MYQQNHIKFIKIVGKIRNSGIRKILWTYLQNKWKQITKEVFNLYENRIKKTNWLRKYEKDWNIVLIILELIQKTEIGKFWKRIHRVGWTVKV